MNLFLLQKKTGLIIDLGEWVLFTACRNIRNMEMSGLPAVKLAVNLSARQFRDPNLIDMIQKCARSDRV